MSNKIHSIKAKIASKLPTSNDDKARMKRACSTAVSALEPTLKIVKEVAGHAGPPGLQTGISGLLFVIGIIKVSRLNLSLVRMLTTMQKSFQNAEDVEKLAQRIEGLTTVLQKSKDGGTLSEAIIDRIDTLST
jgi:hypothetical protein